MKHIIHEGTRPEPIEIMEEVQINGVTWRKNPEKVVGVGRRMGRLMTAALMMAGTMGFVDSPRQRKRPAVDVAKEYELIQQKRSNLSRNDREWVVMVFEENYTKL